MTGVRLAARWLDPPFWGLDPPSGPAVGGGGHDWRSAGGAHWGSVIKRAWNREL